MFCTFDLKIGELKHQDIGQMQMYVNYYDRKVKLPDENPTIGIILCKDKKSVNSRDDLCQKITVRFLQANIKPFCQVKRNYKETFRG